jgi:nucleoside-diphosphate-sugar epimerase
MVIGNGMIAKEFGTYQAKDEYIIFASGVSDSTHSPAAAFEREEKLLRATIENDPGKTLVYFSTCSMYDPSMKGSAYIKHKLNMEALIMQEQPAYVIFRLSNPVGRTTNSNTVVNFFINHILEKHPFSLWKHASRNIIDMDDVYSICNDILPERSFRNSIVNIANPHNYPVHFIVETIEAHFGIKAEYTVADKGDSPHIDVSAIEPLFKKFNINFGPDYLPNLLQKYFPK